MSEHTPLTEAERELLSSLCDNEATRGAGEDGYCYHHHAPVKWAGHANSDDVCCVSVEDYVEQVLAARTSTATADDGLRERVQALADEWDEERHPGMVGIAKRLRAILDATAAPTTDTGARDE